MPILPINVYGDSILRKKASPITNIDDNLIKIIQNMFITMYNANGIGLAANQIGFDKRVFIVDVSAVDGYEKFKPMIFINPKIIDKSHTLVHFEEGCLSIPELKSEILRPREIKINFYDLNMKEITIDIDDLVARVIQHELDHLNGILFIDYLNDEKKKMFRKHLNKIKKRKINVAYPISDSQNYILSKSSL